jgi:hypothetical protein
MTPPASEPSNKARLASPKGITAAFHTAGKQGLTAVTHSLVSLTGRFRYIASRAMRKRFVRNSVWAFNLAPACPRGALTLCRQLCMGVTPGRYSEIGLLSISEKNIVIT